MFAFTQARISTWQIVLLVTVSFFPSRYGTNAIWQGPIGIEAQDFARCSGLQETFSSISLQHAGDIWNIGCRFAPSFVHLKECYWSGFQNEYSNSLTFECRANHVITEIEKLFDQNLEDLRLNFKCCEDKDLVMTACTSTEVMLNTPFSLIIPEDFYVVGWISHRYNQGRSHQFKLCKLKPKAPGM